MLVEHQGRRPQVAPTAYVAPNAVVAGDVVVGSECRILFGAVVTAEGGGRVELGEQVIVMEQALVRGRQGHPARIGWSATRRVSLGEVAGDRLGSGAGVTLQGAHRGVPGPSQQQRQVGAILSSVGEGRMAQLMQCPPGARLE